ncbi:hypothetical protein Ahy_A10g049691 [Arachis hypogaea]|uniref:Ubiquitin-like protease family profile domain-containing protein n=1 Tax=Arachis hypogaea TaxID=3818 RepID=A0A445B7Q0_ARAHY|nr:hypothetical protein Ahy_A10g049691 [Arachis hypogaea]
MEALSNGRDNTYIEAQNMALGKHEGKFLHKKKIKKLFDVQGYRMFIPYLDLKKLESHPFIFALTCYREHWWIWMVDVKNKKLRVLNPYHKKCPLEIRMKLNIFVIRLCDF